MQSYVALQRAVNVGGTGKLPMGSLRAMCIDAGFASPRIYVASGNVVFGNEKTEQLIKAKPEAQLEQHAGKSVGVIVRSAAEIADVVRRNPFSNNLATALKCCFWVRSYRTIPSKVPAA